MKTLPSLHLGQRSASFPIVQGAMGIGVSMSSLAGHVAQTGAVGTLSAVQAGYQEPDFRHFPEQANIRALRREIKQAFAIAKGHGLIAVNIMQPVQAYAKTIEAALEEKVDAIVTGAGLPLEMPKWIGKSRTSMVPILSSVKAVATLLKIWDRKYQYTPDAIVLEGPEAGGHLGFSTQAAEKSTPLDLHALVKEVRTALPPWQEKYGKKIQLIAAGGIQNGRDIAGLLRAGADAVQLASRFVPTYECDAAQAFKEHYLNKTGADLAIIQSPVGMPGRALQTPFLESLQAGRIAPSHCYRCLAPCNPATTLYCISQALINAVQGDIKNGLVFAGKGALSCRRIQSVQEVVQELTLEAQAALEEFSKNPSALPN